MTLNRLAQHLHIPHATIYHVSQQHERDEKLHDQILSALTHHPSYGHRRVALELGLGTRRVRRVMKQFKIKPYKRKARWRKRRDERRQPAPYENIIKGICPIQPSVIWVCDFTYIKHQNKFLYLATYMDRYTREIVGWHVSTKHTKELVITAFWDAFKATGMLPKIVHSDQGVEYTSEAYTKLMHQLNIHISMSKKSSPWENAYQESFYNNFKTDLGLEFDRFENIGEIVEAIHHTIVYYNNKRIHTSLKMSPAQFKQNVLEKGVEKTYT